VRRIDINASFLGVTFSPDSRRVYLSGGENGNIWIADVTAGRIVGSINLNGAAHPLDHPLDPVATPQLHFKGAFPANMALTENGRYSTSWTRAVFQVHVIDTTKIQTGLDAQGRVTEPDNFAAVVGHATVRTVSVRRALSRDNRTLFVTHVGVFQYTHLRPASPTGDANADYPLCFPGVGYPDETRHDQVIEINKVDPRICPTVSAIPTAYAAAMWRATGSTRFPDAQSQCSAVIVGLRAGRQQSAQPRAARDCEDGSDGGRARGRRRRLQRQSSQRRRRRAPTRSSSPTANNDSISVLDPRTYEERSRIGLSLLHGQDRALRGVQPVGLALSPDGDYLYVAEAGGERDRGGEA